MATTVVKVSVVTETAGGKRGTPIYRSWQFLPIASALWVRLRHPSLDMLNNHWQQSRMHLRDGPEIMVSQVKP